MSRLLVHDALLESEQLPISAKLLRIAAEACYPKSISGVATLIGVSRSTASRACRSLTEHGWLKYSGRKNRRIVVPCCPEEAEIQKLELLLWQVELVPYVGEFLMKKLLDEVVVSTAFVENARPSFLMNPTTGQPLEIDRYYKERVGFEYNGDQHHRPTSQYDENEVKRQATRDAIKLGLSVRHNVSIVTVVDRDLSIEGMTSKIPPALTIKPVQSISLYIQRLEELCNNHRAALDKIRNSR